MAAKAVDARRRIHRNERFRLRQRKRDQKMALKEEKGAIQREKWFDFRVLRGSDPTPAEDHH